MPAIEVVPAELFFGMLGYSQLVFDICVASQRMLDWTQAQNAMFAYFGCASVMTITWTTSSPPLSAIPRLSYSRKWIASRSFHARESASSCRSSIR